MNIKRNERRHQRLRVNTKRIQSRQREWYFLEASGNNKRTTPICLEAGFLTYSVETTDEPSDET